jgi:hypothetical protein
MPTNAVNPAKVSEALNRLLSYSIRPFSRGEPKADIPVPIFGVLALASLSKHVTAGRVAPAGTQSLHGLLVPYFKAIPLTEISRAYAEAYRKHIAKDPRRIENLALADYAAKVIELPIGQCLKSLWQNGLLPAALLVPPVSAPPTALYRRIRARIDELKCYKTEEIGSDEVYILTGGSIYDSTGPWGEPQTGHSKVYKDIGAKEIVPLTATESLILDQAARNGPDRPDSPTAICSVTVVGTHTTYVRVWAWVVVTGTCSV